MQEVCSGVGSLAFFFAVNLPTVVWFPTDFCNSQIRAFSLGNVDAVKFSLVTTSPFNLGLSSINVTFVANGSSVTGRFLIIGKETDGGLYIVVVAQINNTLVQR